MSSLVALIPARGGSLRIRRKNIKPLGGKPLLVWTIEAARAAQLFTDVIVSTEDAEIAAIAEQAGARIHLRPACLATDDAPDIGWVRAVLSSCSEEAYAILRPTSPFRDAATIQRAWNWFLSQQPCDSLRAVEPSKQHPGKMWLWRSSYLPGGTSDNPAMGSAFSRERITPVLPWFRTWERTGQPTIRVPWHSNPTQTLPAVFVQNASLEIAWTYTALPPSLTVAHTHDNQGTISGEIVTPFLTRGWEGFDLNTPEDWEIAEAHVQALDQCRSDAAVPAVLSTPDGEPCPDCLGAVALRSRV